MNAPCPLSKSPVVALRSQKTRELVWLKDNGLLDLVHSNQAGVASLVQIISVLSKQYLRLNFLPSVVPLFTMKRRMLREEYTWLGLPAVGSSGILDDEPTDNVKGIIRGEVAARSSELLRSMVPQLIVEFVHNHVPNFRNELDQVLSVVSSDVAEKVRISSLPILGDSSLSWPEVSSQLVKVCQVATFKASESMQIEVRDVFQNDTSSLKLGRFEAFLDKLTANIIDTDAINKMLQDIVLFFCSTLLPSGAGSTSYKGMEEGSSYCSMNSSKGVEFLIETLIHHLVAGVASGLRSTASFSFGCAETFTEWSENCDKERGDLVAEFIALRDFELALCASFGVSDHLTVQQPKMTSSDSVSFEPLSNLIGRALNTEDMFIDRNLSVDSLLQLLDAAVADGEATVVKVLSAIRTAISHLIGNAQGGQGNAAFPVGCFPATSPSLLVSSEPTVLGPSGTPLPTAALARRLLEIISPELITSNSDRQYQATAQLYEEHRCSSLREAEDASAKMSDRTLLGETIKLDDGRIGKVEGVEASMLFRRQKTGTLRVAFGDSEVQDVDVRRFIKGALLGRKSAFSEGMPFLLLKDFESIRDRHEAALRNARSRLFLPLNEMVAVQSEIIQLLKLVFEAHKEGLYLPDFVFSSEAYVNALITLMVDFSWHKRLLFDALNLSLTISEDPTLKKEALSEKTVRSIEKLTTVMASWITRIVSTASSEREQVGPNVGLCFTTGPIDLFTVLSNLIPKDVPASSRVVLVSAEVAGRAGPERYVDVLWRQLEEHDKDAVASRVTGGGGTSPETIMAVCAIANDSRKLFDLLENHPHFGRLSRGGGNMSSFALDKQLDGLSALCAGSTSSIANLCYVDFREKMSTLFSSADDLVVQNVCEGLLTALSEIRPFLTVGNLRRVISEVFGLVCFEYLDGLSAESFEAKVRFNSS